VRTRAGSIVRAADFVLQHAFREVVVTRAERIGDGVIRAIRVRIDAANGQNPHSRKKKFQRPSTPFGARFCTPGTL
jgi:hypothetical protein